MRQLNIRLVKISKGKAALRRIPDAVWGNVLNAIECGDWWIPFDSYEYLDIKNHLETNVFHEFFDLPKDFKLTVKSFQTDILSFEKGH